MSLKEKTYTRVVIDGKYVQDFSVQYETYAQKKWHQERRYAMSTRNPNLAFTSAQKFVEQSFAKLHGAYIIRLEKGQL